MRIEIDARGWSGEGDAWGAVLGAVRALAWHARNLDALADSLWGGVNGVVGPVTLVVSDVSLLLRPPVARMAEVSGAFGSRLDAL